MSFEGTFNNAAAEYDAVYSKCGQHCDLCVHYIGVSEEQRKVMEECLTKMWSIGTFWIYSDDVLSELTDEHLRLYKKYASLEPAWRKKESILCDIYFPIVLGIKRAGMEDKC